MPGDVHHRAADFVAEIDTAMADHLGWTQRVLRCAVTRDPPDEQMLSGDAHARCHFGRWLATAKSEFERLDARKALQLADAHHRMHDAVRRLCQDLVAGRPGDVATLETFELAQAGLVHRLADFKTRILAEAARLDPLTGLPLRYSLEGEFLLGQRAARRDGRCLFVSMIDIDHFKHVNDTWGHLAGDRALRHLADTLRRLLRPSDRLFRYGGEEFLVLMQADAADEAMQGIDRLLAAVRASPVAMDDGTPLALRVTVGLAGVRAEERLEQAIERADQALYRGKRAGRDRCELAPA